MQSPDNKNGEASFSNIPPGNNIPVRWLVAGLGALVLCCVSVTLASAIVILMTGANRGEETTLPPPATFIPPAASPTAAIPAATITLPAASPEGRVTAVRQSTPPTIDGNLEEWDNVPGFTAPYIVTQRDSWDGTMDVASLWRIGWDDQHLYLAVAVTDDVHVQNRETKFAYLGDSLELQLDTNRQANFGPGVNSAHYQYIVSPGNFADRAPGSFRFRGDAAGTMNDFIGSGARVAAMQTAVGYYIEMGIPWSDLTWQPAAGLVLGAAFSLNDLDTPGTAVQELMLSHVPTRRWLDPRSWGTLELAP